MYYWESDMKFAVAIASYAYITQFIENSWDCVLWNSSSACNIKSDQNQNFIAWVWRIRKVKIVAHLTSDIDHETRWVDEFWIQNQYVEKEKF